MKRRRTNEIRQVTEGSTVFGLGFAVNRLTRRALVASGVDGGSSGGLADYGDGGGWTETMGFGMLLAEKPRA